MRAAPSAAQLNRAAIVLARHGRTLIPRAELDTLLTQAADAPPVDSLDRDLAAMTGH